MTNVRSVVRHRLRAAPEAVDQLCLELRAGVLARLPRSERFAIELLLREALMNAVEHGASKKRNAGIDCEIRVITGGMKIRVADGGPGFDWRACRAAAPNPLGECGRGLDILHRYASLVQFSEKGDQVELTRMFQQGEPS